MVQAYCHMTTSMKCSAPSCRLMHVYESSKAAASASKVLGRMPVDGYDWVIGCLQCTARHCRDIRQYSRAAPKETYSSSVYETYEYAIRSA